MLCSWSRLPPCVHGTESYKKPLIKYIVSCFRLITNRIKLNHLPWFSPVCRQPNIRAHCTQRTPSSQPRCQSRCNRKAHPAHVIRASAVMISQTYPALLPSPLQCWVHTDDGTPPYPAATIHDDDAQREHEDNGIGRIRGQDACPLDFALSSINTEQRSPFSPRTRPPQPPPTPPPGPPPPGPLPVPDPNVPTPPPSPPLPPQR